MRGAVPPSAVGAAALEVRQFGAGELRRDRASPGVCATRSRASSRSASAAPRRRPSRFSSVTRGKSHNRPWVSSGSREARCAGEAPAARSNPVYGACAPCAGSCGGLSSCRCAANVLRIGEGGSLISLPAAADCAYSSATRIASTWRPCTAAASRPAVVGLGATAGFRQQVHHRLADPPHAPSIENPARATDRSGAPLQSSRDCLRESDRAAAHRAGENVSHSRRPCASSPARDGPSAT